MADTIGQLPIGGRPCTPRAWWCVVFHTCLAYGVMSPTYLPWACCVVGIVVPIRYPVDALLSIEEPAQNVLATHDWAAAATERLQQPNNHDVFSRQV